MPPPRRPKSLLPPFTLPDRIRLLRKFADLSQIDLANQLQGSQGWLSKIESGELEISSSQLLRLRDFFGVSADALLDGVIPYREAAIRFRHTPVLPPQYAASPKIRMRAAYPFIAIYEKKLSPSQLTAIFKPLGIPPFAFADPETPVNPILIWHLVEKGDEAGLFGTNRIFEELARQVLHVGADAKSTRYVPSSGDGAHFLEKWIETARQMGADHEFTLELIGEEKAEIQSRYPVPYTALKRDVSAILDRYYQHFLIHSLREKEGGEWDVRISVDRDVAAKMGPSLRAVHYHVVRK